MPHYRYRPSVDHVAKLDGIRIMRGTAIGLIGSLVLWACGWLFAVAIGAA